MSEVRKAAVLLLSLDKQLAASVLGQVRKDLVEKLMLEVAKLQDVPEEEQVRVIEEFATTAKVRSHIERGGIDFADQLLRESLGEDGADAILDNVRQSLSSVPFGFLQKVGADNFFSAASYSCGCPAKVEHYRNCFNPEGDGGGAYLSHREACQRNIC